MLKRNLLSFVTLCLATTVMAQSPKGRPTPKAPEKIPDNMSVVRPYWALGDSRELSIVGEVIYYKNDTLDRSFKAKWDGAIEVIRSDGKTMDVAVSETVVENKITFNDLQADVQIGNPSFDVVVQMDKQGKFLDILNYDEMKELYLSGKEKDKRAEEKKMSKEDRAAFVDSLDQEITKDDRFKASLLAYPDNFLSIYGRMVPTEGDTIRSTATINTRRFFAKATKNVEADKVLYVSDTKGGKFTLMEKYSYDYSAMDDFLVGFPDGSTRFEAVTKVTNTIETSFDSKASWPQKITEELTVTKGPYKVVYKRTVKFIKAK